MRYYVSPKLVVARNPTLHLLFGPKELVAWLPEMPAPMPLSPEEVLLLSEILAGVQPTGPARDLTEQLLEKGVLVTDEVPAAAYPLSDIAELCSPEGAAPAGLPPPARRLQLRWNFAMRPSAGGFVVWSVLSRRYLRIPVEGVAVLRLFAEGLDLGELAASTSAGALRWIEVLRRHGILAPAQAPESEKIAPTRMYDIANSLWDDIKSAEEELAALPRTSLAPAAGTSKRKIPIYSVYCTTELEVRAQLPLALGMIRAFAQSYKGGALLERYEFVPEYCFSPGAVRRAVARHGPGVALFSDYVWSIESNLVISRALKELSREFITIHGGPSVPAYEAECERFFQAHDHVDVAVRGEGETTAIELLETLGAFVEHWPPPLECLREVQGITWRSAAAHSGCVRNAERPRAQDIGQFPSPYLTGAFDACTTDTIIAAVLETNRGCPYSCTFCDWGSAINQKIKVFELERVRAEIEWIAARKIPVIWCADANFGIFDRDVEIAKMVADAKRRHGFPRQFLVNYAKNATTSLAEIISILHAAEIAAEGIISVQTTDPTTLRIIKRSNIKTKRYDELLGIFRNLKLPISTDLMLGLPGSTMASLQNDLQYYFDREVPANAYKTEVLPNSPMADPAYMKKYEIEIDEQKQIVSTFSFTAEEYARMQSLYMMYRLFANGGVLHYVLRYLQWDLGMQCVDELRRLDEFLRARPDEYTAIMYVTRFGRAYFNLSGWRPFYDEMMRYLARERGVKIDAALQTAFRVQEAVMRDAGRVFPETVQLAHDFVTYFLDQRAARAGDARAPASPLSSYPPATLVVTDPNGLCVLEPRRNIQYDGHIMRWELSSPLATAAPVAFFIDMAQQHSAEAPA